MHHRIGKEGHKYAGKRGAGIIFTDGKQILLLQRANGEDKDTWGQPGGQVEDGETSIDAAIREAQEECGNFEGCRIGEFEEIDGLHRWMTYIYKIKQPFDCKLSNEHKAWKWFNFHELKYVDLHPKFKENLHAYLKLIHRKFESPPTFREWLENVEPQDHTIDIKIDSNGIEYKLFINHKNEHCIRVRDIDAQENYILKIYPTPEMAKVEYDKLIAKIETENIKPIVCNNHVKFYPTLGKFITIPSRSLATGR